MLPETLSNEQIEKSIVIKSRHFHNNIQRAIEVINTSINVDPSQGYDLDGLADAGEILADAAHCVRAVYEIPFRHFRILRDSSYPKLHTEKLALSPWVGPHE